MGFPDDGYDYLKHMRAGSRATGTAELLSGESARAAEPTAGPPVFVPAQQRQLLEDDEKMFDARQLVIHEPATDDVRTAPGWYLRTRQPSERLHFIRMQPMR